jgi:hypothetical protein
VRGLWHAVRRVVLLAGATAIACWLAFQLDRSDVGLYDRMASTRSSRSG